MSCVQGSTYLPIFAARKVLEDPPSRSSASPKRSVKWVRGPRSSAAVTRRKGRAAQCSRSCATPRGWWPLRDHGGSSTCTTVWVVQQRIGICAEGERVSIGGVYAWAYTHLRREPLPALSSRPGMSSSRVVIPRTAEVVPRVRACVRVKTRVREGPTMRRGRASEWVRCGRGGASECMVFLLVAILRTTEVALRLRVCVCAKTCVREAPTMRRGRGIWMGGVSVW